MLSLLQLHPICTAVCYNSFLSLHCDRCGEWFLTKESRKLCTMPISSLSFLMSLLLLSCCSVLLTINLNAGVKIRSPLSFTFVCNRYFLSFCPKLLWQFGIFHTRTFYLNRSFFLGIEFLLLLRVALRYTCALATPVSATCNML